MSKMREFCETTMKILCENIIEVEELVVKYGNFVALNKISFFVKKGEIFGLLGPNGAGKSTTIRTLTTLLKPFSGRIKIMGYDIIKESHKIRGKIALMMQEHALDVFLTVYENLYFYAMLEKMPRKERKSRISELLDLFGLADKRNSPVFALSGGQFRRLQLARTFLSSADIFFLDEPTLGIDIEGKEKFWEFLRLINKNMDITMVVATNDLREAEKLCDRIAFIKSGEVIAIDTPENLKELINLRILVIKVTESIDNKDIIKNNHIIKGYKVKENNVIEMEVSDCYNDLSMVLANLKMGKHFQVLEYKRPTLEDVFVNLTKG